MNEAPRTACITGCFAMVGRILTILLHTFYAGLTTSAAKRAMRLEAICETPVAIIKRGENHESKTLNAALISTGTGCSIDANGSKSRRGHGHAEWPVHPPKSRNISCAWRHTTGGTPLCHS